MNKLQKQVGFWADRTFPLATTKSIVAHLHDEGHELDRAEGLSELREESADIMILLLHLAYLNDFDLIEATKQKLALNRRRSWGQPDERGVVHHI